MLTIKQSNGNDKTYEINVNLIEIISNFKLAYKSSMNINDNYVESPNERNKIFYKKQNIIEVAAENLKKFSKEKINHFEDELFPPNDKSMYSAKKLIQKSTGEEDNQAYFKQKIWLSISKYINNEIFSNKNFLLGENIRPDELKQGSLSDCYYLSSLCPMAYNINLILRLFPILDMDRIQELINMGENPADLKYQIQIIKEMDCVEYTNEGKFYLKLKEGEI